MPPINYYPNTYTPYNPYQFLPQYTSPTPAQTTQTPQQISTGIIWVSNEQEAQNYPVAPNNAVALWDSTDPVIYLKQSDAAGRPNIKVYDLKERIDASSEPQKQVLVNDKYAEKSELSAFKSDIESLRNEFKNIKKELTAIRRRQEDDDD